MAINLEDFPINQPGPELDRVIAGVSANLDQDGCAVLWGFLTPQGIRELVREADAKAANGHHSHSRTNPYFTKDDPSLPPADLDAAAGAVARD